MTRALAKAPDPGKEKPKESRPAKPPRELREVLASPGHPLDPGLRRDLETKLGHDFSRVRVHNDTDSAAVTELLGADAVTVGQDIFFGRSLFRPETTDGRQLLVHELLHTVQVPDPQGAVRLGRDAGSVSRPSEPLELEAERGAQSEEKPSDEQAQGAAWMRYATVDADRMRTEQLDPATLVDRLVAGVLRSLRGDPTDRSGRIRLQLSRFTPELRNTVLIKLETRLPSSEYARVLELVAEADQAAAGGPVESALVPEPVTDPAQQTDADRERAEDIEHGEQEQEEQQDADQEESEKDEKDQEEPEEKPEEEQEEDKESGKESPEDEDKKKDEAEDKEEKDKEKKEEEDKDEKEGKEKGEKTEEAVAQASTEAAAQPLAQAPGAPGAAPPGGQGPAAGTAPLAEGPAGETQPGPARPERVEAAAQAPESPLVQHGLLERREDEDQTEEQEKPIGLEPDAEAEVDLPEPEQKAPEEEQPEQPELKPEDYLPSSDLDVSNVPTADRLTLPSSGAPPPQPEAPSFPSPPPTKAEQAEEEAPPEPGAATAEPEAAAPPAEPAEPVESAEEPPAEQPLDAEVGPDPETAQATVAPLAPAPPEPVEATEPETGPGDRLGPEPMAAEPAAGPAGPGGGAIGADTGSPGLAEPSGLAEPAGMEPGGAEVADPGMAGPVAPEASLEPGGGSCAGAPEPTTEGAKAEGGKGGCAAGGGGGAAPAPAEQQPAPPDVSGQAPEAALATVSTLPPDKMQTSLSGVDAAATRAVGEEQAALQGAPPSMERPSGAPQTMAGPPESAPPVDIEKIKLERAEAARAEQQKKAEAERVQGTAPASQVARPHVAGDAQGNISAAEIENVQQAVQNVPTSDPAMNTTVGPAPKVELTGEADPVQTDEQAAKLQESSTRMHTAGREESAKNLGEDKIFPNAPAETLAAEVPSGGGEGGPPAAAGPGPGGADMGVAVVAQQERGPQIQAGVAEGQAQMGTERQTQQQGAAEANAQHEAEVARTVQENADAQTAERGKVAADAAAKREEWRGEQDAKIEESNTEAGEEHAKAKTDISAKKTEADEEAEQKQQDDNDRIASEREAAEEKARKEKEEKERESEDDGFFSWLASKVTDFFNALLDAITAIFDAAIKAINTIIQEFAKAVTALIELARDAIVGLINALADALIALCDVLAVFFPELAAKMRSAIEDLRDAAIAVVNELADALKAGVEFLLNKLAEALTGLLRLLEAGLKAAVNIVRTAVNAAIEFAKAAIQMLGEFAAIIADIAAMGVGPWLGRLGSSAKEGIQNHLWDAIKSAVKQWFNEKVESVLGLGRSVINILIKGCISMAKIGKMAWDALIAALPMIIIMVVIERLVSLIIPAAGAVLAVVQGLMAAWGTISKILAAIGAFMAFLKAVKAGPAACLFAAAVAAGVVALLEFITNFLMAKLATAAKPVGRSLQGMAKKISKGLGRAGKGPRKAAGNAVNSARRDLKSASRAISPARPATRRPGRPVAGTRGRPGAPGRPGAGTRGRPAPGRRPGAPRRPEAPGRRRPAEPSAPRRVNPARAALNRVGGAVRKGLRKVGTTLKKVGRKVANSKVGRALKNTAKKLRDKYRRTRDRLRERLRRRQDQRNREDKRKKNQEQTKDQRLALIVAKIRPKLERLLKLGVHGRILRGLLAGMRVFYRLTALRIEGVRDFVIRALLNPDEPVVLGKTFDIANITVEVDRLLRAIRKIGQEIEESGAARNIPRGRRKARTTETTLPMAGGGQRQAILAESGAGGAEVQAAIRRRRTQPERKSDAVQLLANTANPLTVIRRFRSRSPRQRPNPRNRLVDVTDPKTGQTKGVSYDEFKGILKSTGREQEIAEDALGLLAARTPRGQYPQLAAEVNVWVMHQEGHRNIAGLATHAMALDMAARGDMPLQKAVDLAPMSPGGAPAQAQEAVRYLNESRNSPVRPDRKWVLKADALAQRELTMVKLWVESLKDLKIKDSGSQAEKERELILEVRRRIHAMYGLKTDGKVSADQFLKRVESEDVIL